MTQKDNMPLQTASSPNGTRQRGLATTAAELKVAPVSPRATRFQISNSEERSLCLTARGNRSGPSAQGSKLVSSRAADTADRGAAAAI